MSDTRMHVYREKIITDGNMTGTLVSDAIDLNKTNTRSFSIQFTFTGTNTLGTLSLECSNDQGVTYTQITDSVLPVSGVSSGSDVINVEFPAYELVRARYVPTSGTGTAQCYINGKQ